MNLSALSKHQVYWSFAIVFTIAVAIISTIFSLSRGIYDVFPFLYFLPIIIFVYFYPRQGVIFSVSISTVYLVLVYYFSGFNPALVAVSTAWYVIFITIGVVTSSFATGLRDEERKYRGIFENSQAGIFTFDLSALRILDINIKCARMLKYAREDLIGADLSLILPDSGDRDAFLRRLRDSRYTGDSELLFHTQDGTGRQFLVSASLTPNTIVIISAIDITERKMAEHVIQKARDDLEIRVKERTEELMRANEDLKAEILERKRFETAIQLANRKLNTLSSITRHDILNQITAIGLYLSLAEELATGDEVISNLRKIGKITDLIRIQIQFTRDYQDIGASAPEWQDVSLVITTAIADIDRAGLRVEKELEGLEVYADLLFHKVFSNIVENTIRHGERATYIRFYLRETNAGIAICCEDDGIGIPQNAKERIFKREYYRNTGYGLFLADEILSITGISIRETGVEGMGARFEILVPRGAYQIQKKS